MHKAGVQRLVLASSMVVYGEGRYEVPCPRCGADLEPLLVGEDARLDPRSTYAAAELLGYRARVGFAEGVTNFATDPLRGPSVHVKSRRG